MRLAERSCGRWPRRRAPPRKRVLPAEIRRQQNESGSLVLIGNTQKNPVGLIVNAPGIAGFTGAGCNAGNDCVKLRARKCFESGVAVAGILELHCFASRNVGMPAGHGGHFPAAGDQFTRNGCTDITGRSGQQDAMCS